MCERKLDAMYLTTLDVLQEKSVDVATGTVPSLLICRICNYKALDRPGIIRHVKYSHTCFRPYGCGICDYVAVETTKVSEL